MKTRSLVLKLMVTFVILLGLTPTHVSSRDLSPKAIETALEKFYADHEDTAAGMAVAVFTSDEVLYKGYYGHANREKAIQVTEETVFEWGSISKILVWISLMQLKEANLVDFDKDTRHYLHDPLLRNTRYQDPITINDLMSHTAGFQEIYHDTYIHEFPYDYSLAKTLIEMEPIQIYKPGTTIAYSNYSTALGALIVEEVTDMRFDQYVHQYILEPLGMAYTGVYTDLSDNPWVQARRSQTAYYDNRGEQLDIEPYFIALYPAGMTSGTLDDLTKLGQALILNDNQDSLLFQTESAHREFHHATDFYSKNYDLGLNYHGLWHYQYEHSLIGHAGNTAGQSANLMVDVDNNIGMVILTNQAQEMVFNYQMPELIFGSAKESHNLAMRDGREPGFYQMARIAKEGPFSFTQMQIIPHTLTDIGFKLTVPDYEDGKHRIKQPIFEWVKISNLQAFFYLIILIFILLALTYSPFTIVHAMIKLLKGRPLMASNRIHKIANSLVFFSVLNIFILFMQMVNYNTGQQYLPTLILFFFLLFALIICLFFYLFKIREATMSQLDRCHGFLSIALLALAITIIIYFDFYQFWFVF